MITWLDQPFKGTNKHTGFEMLIHGFYLQPNGLPAAICVDEGGGLYLAAITDISIDWRFKRGRGWFSIDDDAETP